MLLTFAGRDAGDVSAALAAHHINAPAGSFYAYEPSRCSAWVPAAVCRIGLAPYNTAADVDRLIGVLTTTLDQRP